LNLLETGRMITRIRPLATNSSSAIVNAPKLLWTDCGLAAWLAGIKSSAAEFAFLLRIFPLNARWR
jgi:hypothetical protein